jgi:PPOX class probable F420-dependent enzyme
VANRRDQIKLTPEEQSELLDEQRVVIATTIGPRGWPHSMPLWYVVRDGDIWAWTFAKSQKVKNLERDDRCTLLVETGEQYNELRGIQIEARAEIIRDIDRIVDFAKELTIRYTEGIEEIEGDAAAALEAQAPKRVALHFHPERTATWDHRKLGGTY